MRSSMLSPHIVNESPAQDTSYAAAFGCHAYSGKHGDGP
jgi:hypothetical protein